MSINTTSNKDIKKNNFARKFIEQQATKDFIKKENKPVGKSKLKLKGPVDKRDFKLTVSRALNVEEIEINKIKNTISNFFCLTVKFFTI